MEKSKNSYKLFQCQIKLNLKNFPKIVYRFSQKGLRELIRYTVKKKFQKKKIVENVWFVRLIRRAEIARIITHALEILGILTNLVTSGEITPTATSNRLLSWPGRQW